MSMEYRKQYRKGPHASSGIGWSVILIIGLVALVLALPALALGLVLQRLTSMRPWSFPLWFFLTLIGSALLYYLSTHGLNRMITAQLTDYVLATKRYHADIAQWNISRLWSDTWPVWIRTLVMTPIISFWRTLEEGVNGDSTRFLHQQERERQRLVARSKSRAIRRTQHPERIPDAVHGQMVVGVSIDDEHAE